MGQDLLVLPEGSVINMNSCSHKSETIQEASDVPWSSQQKLSCSTTLILKGLLKKGYSLDKVQRLTALVSKTHQ